jgi:hypothetical protein
VSRKWSEKRHEECLDIIQELGKEVGKLKWELILLKVVLAGRKQYITELEAKLAIYEGPKQHYENLVK